MQSNGLVSYYYNVIIIANNKPIEAKVNSDLTNARGCYNGHKQRSRASNPNKNLYLLYQIRDDFERPVIGNIVYKYRLPNSVLRKI